MNLERWQQIDNLLQAALAQEPAKRAAFLDSACTNDESLREEVDSLLSSGDEALGFIDTPAFEVAASLFARHQPELVEGQAIAHYRILSFLGAGGMGEVYLARDTKLGRNVALKLLPVDYTLDEKRLRRFQQEAQTASALNHPNILTIHELGEVDGQQFIATEFVEGETLRERLKRGPLNLPETLDIAIQIVGALRAAHKAGIVHRDIKPENIMLRRDGYVKVLDFGLAKLTETREQSTETFTGDTVDISSGVLMGTVKYMSPEQARGLSVDARSDIFSLGVVLYELVAGHAPFEAKSANDLIAAILSIEPEPLVSVPDELELIINQALRKDRAERYRTVEDLLIDLKQLKERLELESKVQQSTVDQSQRTVVISDTRSAVSTGELEAVDTTATVQYLIGLTQPRKIGATVVLALALAAVGFAFYKFVRLRRAAIPFQNTKVTRLTTSGNTWSPAISRDGKYVVFGSVENGKVSLWRRQIGTNSEVQILPPVEGILGGTAFTPDGKYVYYSIGMANDYEVYQVPASGGTARRIPINAGGRVSVSPDGQRLAYVRFDKNRYEQTLLTANADGTDERTILKQKADAGCEYCDDLSWSPEGASLAYAGHSGSGKDRVMEVNVSDRTARPISSPEWTHVVFIVWLPDKSGLIVVAASEHTGPQQIWHVTYPGGEVRKLTSDFGDYDAISLSSDGKALITAQREVESRIWTAPVAANDSLLPDLSQAKQVSVNRFDGRSGLSFTPDGKIVYGSQEGGETGIWIMDADGESRKQLAANGLHPAVSPDGRYVVFQSIKDGFIWRMDIDGGNLKQLADGGYPSISPDSNWVLYNRSQWTAWKVSIEGGVPIQILNTQGHMPKLSPDGNLLAYGYFAEKNEPRLAIAPPEGGQPIKTFVLPCGFSVYDWTPDGKALTFCASKDLNIWIQPIEGGPPRKLTDLSPSNIIYTAWSVDGRQLAFVRTTPVRDVVLISDLQ